MGEKGKRILSAVLIAIAVLLMVSCLVLELAFPPGGEESEPGKPTTDTTEAQAGETVAPTQTEEIQTNASEETTAQTDAPAETSATQPQKPESTVPKVTQPVETQPNVTQPEEAEVTPSDMPDRGDQGTNWL